MKLKAYELENAAWPKMQYGQKTKEPLLCPALLLLY
jgi:hypothetical protein